MLIIQFLMPQRCYADHSESAVLGVGLGLLDTGIVGSKPTRGIYVCPRLSMLCYPVYVETLRRADPSSKESYQLFENGSEISHKEAIMKAQRKQRVMF
jgi:hypothetical protein